MLPNGLILCLEMALGPRAATSRADRERSAALVLGMFREDICILPGIGWSMPSPSLGHLYPRSRQRCETLFEAAVDAARAGEPLRGALWLGRALHVLIDMACPAHAQAVAHSLREPFEVYVEAHAAELADCPMPELPVLLAQEGTPSELVESLASAARREQVDGTSSPWGAVFRRLRWRQPISGAIVHEQAQRLIPLAAAHVRALIARYEAAIAPPAAPLPCTLESAGSVERSMELG